MNRRPRIFALLFIFFSVIQVFGQSKLNTSIPFKSTNHNIDIKYSVYLPDGYHHAKTYPTLFLLHGFGGDETSWVIKGNAQAILDSLINTKILPPVVVVLPGVQNSYYINDYKGILPMEEILVQEFIPYINKTYPTDLRKTHRAIAGLSMGGYGATILPVKHPELFGTSINLSGAVRTDEIFIQQTPAKYHQYFAPLFGESLSGTDRITPHWKANSPYYLIDSIKAQELKTIHWYIDCGTDDFLFDANKAMHEHFMKYKIPHEFHTRPGEHTWHYWRKGIILAMLFWGEILRGN
jgi:S-formylglutathione hydrolase FrmB